MGRGLAPGISIFTTAADSREMQLLSAEVYPVDENGGTLLLFAQKKGGRKRAKGLAAPCDPAKKGRFALPSGRLTAELTRAHSVTPAVRRKLWRITPQQRQRTVTQRLSTWENR